MHIKRQASFSRCQRYRYQLSRRWQVGQGRCVFIGLNPSTADATQDDPTIRRCMGFVRDWGYQELLMVNLFAYRTPNPRELKQACDPVGPGNRRAVRRACENADLVVAAWGAHGTFRHQAQRWAPMLIPLRLQCFGLTRQLQPVHPLYQRRDAKLGTYDYDVAE